MAEELNGGGRVAYLEARVGELNNTIGELRAESENRLQVGDRLGWRLVEAQQEIERLRSELDRLHSWAGLMELLDEHWPAEVFDGQSEDSDPGPRIVSLIRAVDAERASRQAWAEQAAALKDAARESYDELGYYIQVLTNTDRPEIAGRRVAATKAQRIIGGYFSAVMADWHDAEDRRVCACVTDEQAAQIKSAGPLWVRPQCAVHDRCMEGRSDA